MILRRKEKATYNKIVTISGRKHSRMTALEHLMGQAISHLHVMDKVRLNHPYKQQEEIKEQRTTR